MRRNAARLPILAIDPGPTESAYVLWDGERVLRSGKEPNADVLAALMAGESHVANTCVCERIRSYGMAVGAEVFETCEWVGRFWQGWTADSARREWQFITRQDVKLHLCNSVRAKDTNVRQSLIDCFGGKDKAIGKKANPGPLYGISGDVWAALGVAVTYWDKNVRIAA
jgi:hypothetical protein